MENAQFRLFFCQGFMEKKLNTGKMHKNVIKITKNLNKLYKSSIIDVTNDIYKNIYERKRRVFYGT